ncbi:MAG: putative Ig domain-containing protein, partial [Clostridia bacterium]|nr:putative Ig domain-containing protein [Clostridia bacterium]
LSMAVAPYIIEGLGTNTAYFDYFNVMTYDANGSGTDNVASYEWTMSQLNSYAYQSIEKSKMNMGLPFYGYSTDGRPAWNCDYDYAKVVKMCTEQGNTNFLTQDSITFPGEYNQNQPGTSFKVEFNSQATLIRKTEYVRDSNLGGIMIWDVTKDCISQDNSQYALLPQLASLLAYPSSYDGPTNLVASDLTEESVHLEWDGPTSYNPSGYKVYYDNTYLGTITTTNTCCVVEDLSEGFTYQFKVVAIDPDGTETAPAQCTVTVPGTAALPSLPEWSANTFYSTGTQVIYNGQVWKARWGGSNETPTGVSGNMWILDESVVITPAKTPVLRECEEHGVPTAPTITTASLADAKEGYSYNKTLTAKGTKPITWSIVAGSLPAGLTLDSATGTISGTPTTPGTYNFTVRAYNGIGTAATQALSILVKEKPETIDPDANEPGTSKRVIGYIPWWRAEESKQLDFDKLDYVIVAFLRYTSEGWDFGGLNNTIPWSDSDLRTLVSTAHAHDCKVLISVGGGDGGFIQSSLPFWYENSREYLANCILEVVDEYGFDGVDMDAETDDIKFWQGYNEFVDLMRVGLDARNLEMSMAVHTWFTDLIENEAELYAKYDFLNVMNYDNQYDRSGNRPGIGEVDHAPMWHAYQMLDHYTDLGVPADKINVGIPFYYYRASLGWDGAVSYAYTKDGSGLDGVTIDTLPGESKADAWKRTTSQKAYLGGTEYGGAFIWELGQDTVNNKSDSLLNIVYNGVKNGIVTTPLDPADKVYPELAPVNGTDLPLTPVNKDSVQPDFPAMGGSSGGSSSGGGASGNIVGEFNWSTNYALGDIVSYNGYLYECIRAGWAINQPQGAGYDNANWRYLGPVGSVTPGGGGSSSGGDDGDDGERVLVDPYWWLGAEAGETLAVDVPSGESVTWSVRAIDGADPVKSSIISVDANGVISALSEGCAVVDAKVGNTRVASINVQVLGQGGSNPDPDPDPDPVDIDAFVFKVGYTNAYWTTYDYSFEVEVPCQYVGGATYVPFRVIAQAAGAKDVFYDQNAATVTLVNSYDMTFVLNIDSTECTVIYDGQSQASTINSAPTFIDGAVCLPVRDVANVTFASVEYISYQGSGYVLVSAQPLDADQQVAAIEAYEAI